MSKTEWNRYKVGLKSTKKNWTEPSCQPFSVVRHITHLKDAFRIIEDGVIRSSLVWDESKLSNTRTCVSWVSPNKWAYGSIYGNISFGYLWNDLVKGRSFYWVEDFKKYNPPAYRILITDNDYSTSKLVTPYPVEDSNGPIYFDGVDWYRNGNFTGEFLIDDDLQLNICHEIGFEDHHTRLCSKSGSNCKDLGLKNYEAGGRLLSYIIGKNLTFMNDKFWDISADEKKLTFQAQGAISGIFHLFQNKYSSGSSKISSTSKYYLTKACLFALSENNTDFLNNVIPMIGNEQVVFEVLKEVVEQFFDSHFEDIA